jgi:hypothetical protein
MIQKQNRSGQKEKKRSNTKKSKHGMTESDTSLQGASG